MQSLKTITKTLLPKRNKYKLKLFNHKTFEILCILLYFAAKNKKNYCFIKIDTIKKMCKIRGLKISERSIFYHLAYLEEKKFIIRKQRIGHNGKEFIFKSTIYIICEKALNKMRGLIKFIRSTENILGYLFSFKKQGFDKFISLLKRKSEVFRDLNPPRQILFMLELEDAFLEAT